MPLQLIGVDHRDDNIEERIDQALEEDDLVLVEGLHPDEEEEFYSTLLEEGEEVDEPDRQPENKAVQSTVNEGNIVYLDEGFELLAEVTKSRTERYENAREPLQELLVGGAIEDIGDEEIFYLVSMVVGDDTSYEVHFGEPVRTPGQQVEIFLRSIYDGKGIEIDEDERKELEKISKRVDKDCTWKDFKDRSAEIILHTSEDQERERYWKQKIDIAAKEYDADDLTIVVGSLHAMETDGNLRDKLESEYDVEVAPLTEYVKN